VPIKIMLQDRPVFLCCKGCVQQAQDNPEAILKKIGPLKLKETRAEPKSDRSAAKQYDVTAMVVAIGADQESVTLDHDDIPGLMRGMTMRFGVESPDVLQGIECICPIPRPAGLRRYPQVTVAAANMNEASTAANKKEPSNERRAE